MVKRFDLFDLTRIQFFTLLTCAFCILLIPLFNHRYISINDLINHFSRVWILLHYSNTSVIHAFYRVTWHAVPNMALDIFGFVVGHFLSLDLASKLFVALAMFANLIGVAHLHHTVHGRWTIWTLIAAPLMFSRLLLVGFVNYLFGIGLALNAIAFQIALRERPVARFAVLTGFALATYFSHLFAFGLLGVTVFGIELKEFWASRGPLGERLRQAVLAMLPFVPAIAIFLWVTPHGDVGGSMRFHTLLGRMTAFGTPILYDPPTDILMYAGLMVAVVVAVAGRRKIRIYWPLAAAGLVLFLLQLVVPFSIMTSTNVDQRIPLFIYLLAIAAVDAAPVDAVGQAAFAAILLVVIGVRVWTVDARWRAFDAIYTSVDDTLSAVPAGAKLACAFPMARLDHASAPAITVFQLPVRAVVQNAGFVQTVYALPLQDTVVLTDTYRSLTDATENDRIWQAFAEPVRTPAELQNRLAESTSLRRYDYIVFVDNLGQPRVHPMPWMKLTATGSYSQVYRIAKNLPNHLSLLRPPGKLLTLHGYSRAVAAGLAHR